MVTKAARAEVRERAGNCCADCGGTYNLQIHHVKSKGMGGVHGKAALVADAPDNLVLICQYCHAERHGERVIRPKEHDGATHV